MIGHLPSASSLYSPNTFRKAELSPSKAAEKERIEARLEVLEEKMAKQKSPSGLDPAENDQRLRLQDRDAEVRSHEMAHQAAAGGLSQGGMSLVYQIGPDGRSYAIGGSVQIDTSPGRTPEETIQKARKIRASAMAPSDPSPQDVKVAAQASQMEAQALAEIAKREREPESSGVAITHSKQVAPSEGEAPVAESEEAVEDRVRQRVALAYRG